MVSTPTAVEVKPANLHDAPGGPHPQGFGLPKPSLTIECTHSKMEPTTVWINSEVELLDAAALAEWPILPRHAGLNFTVIWCDGVSTPYTLCDQGRQLGRARMSMGLGIKLTSPRVQQTGAQCAQCCAPLPFVVVALVRCGSRVNEAIKLCEARGLGGEQGYGVLHPSTHMRLIYDKARSPAWYVNKSDDNNKLARTSACLKINSKCHWVPVIRPTPPVQLGRHVLITYGSGSDHHSSIRAEATERQAREPSCVKAKREQQERLARACRQRYAKFKSGDRIMCKFDGSWFDGTVTKFDGDRYCADFDDGTSYDDLCEVELKANR